MTTRILRQWPAALGVVSCLLFAASDSAWLGSLFGAGWAFLYGLTDDLESQASDIADKTLELNRALLATLQETRR